MTELVTTVADKIDRAVQRVTPFAYRVRRRGRRWVRRALRKPRSVSEGKLIRVLDFSVTTIRKRFTPSCGSYFGRLFTSSKTFPQWRKSSARS